jgi:hypothetical protein
LIAFTQTLRNFEAENTGNDHVRGAEQLDLKIEDQDKLSPIWKLKWAMPYEMKKGRRVNSKAIIMCLLPLTSF